MKAPFRQLFPASILAAILAVAAPVLAAAPQFDTGADITSLDKPYESAQAISGGIFENRSVYGKLDDSTSADIYSFKADRDGEQTFSLMMLPRKADASADPSTSASPYLFFIDPTSATTAEQVGLPVPSDAYHVAVITAQTDKSYYDPAVLQKYQVLAQQKVKLTKGDTYYFVVVDQYGQPSDYVLKIGEGNSWTLKDVLAHPAAWFQVRFNAYGGSDPFTFTVDTFVLLLLVLGIALTLGTFVIEQAFSFMANRSKAAGYLLTRLQPFSRVLYWTSLWLTAIGSYLYFDRVAGFVGLPSAMIISFLVLVAALLYQTFGLAPRLMKLEVTAREATVPFALRKRLFFAFLVELLSLGAVVTFLVMLLTA